MQKSTFLVSALRTVLIGGSLVIALFILTTFLDTRIQELVSFQEVDVVQDAAISKSSSKKCPAPEALQTCFMVGYYREKGLTESEIAEVIAPSGSFGRLYQTEAPKCPTSKQQLGQCYIDVMYDSFDKQYGLTRKGSADAKTILAELSNARLKGAEAAVKSSINNARAMAELFYDSNRNSYANVCTASGGINSMIESANKANGGGATMCKSTATTWVAAAQLSDLKKYYCADSTGRAATYEKTLSSTMNQCPTQ